MKAILSILFLITIALEGETISQMMIQLSLILIISMSFLAYEKRERRIHKLKEDVWRR
jgi:hypothetical protein